MQDQPIYNQSIIEKAYILVDHLHVSLKFIDACFKSLHYQKLGPVSFSLTYHYSDTQEFISFDEIIADLKRCITYQMSGRSEISIPAEIIVSQKVSVDRQELDIFYYGAINLFDSGGWINYHWYQSTPNIHITLYKETSGDTILSLFNNFQEAITDQINKNK